MAPLWGSAGRGALLGPHGGPLAGSNLVAGSTLQWRGTPYGLGARISGASNLLYQNDFAPVTTSDGAGTGDFTLLILANPPAEAVISEALSQTAGASAPRADLLFNTNASIAASSGAFTFITGGTGGTYPSAANVINGLYHVFAGRRTGTELSVWIDGIKRASTTQSVQDIWSNTSGFAIGNRAEDATGFRINTATAIIFAAAWNRSLSDAEMRALAIDPFVMFRPAPEWLGVWTSLGGGNAILSPADMTGSLQFETPVISQNHVMAPVDVFIAENFETPALNIGGVLNPAKSFFASSADTPAFLQNHNLPAQEMYFAFSSNSPLLAMNAQGTPDFRNLGIGANSRKKNISSNARGAQTLTDSRSKSITE